MNRPIWFQEHYIASSAITGGLPRAGQKMSISNYVLLLVQEQVYAWVIASSFVMLLEAPPPPPPVRRTPRSWNQIGLYVFLRRSLAHISTINILCHWLPRPLKKVCSSGHWDVSVRELFEHIISHFQVKSVEWTWKHKPYCYYKDSHKSN